MQLKTVDIVLSVLGSAAFLAVAVLAWLRGRVKGTGPVAWPFALLCVDMFAYNLLQAISDLTLQPAWHWLNAVSASSAAPLFYQLVVAFVGRRYPLRWAIRACDVWFFTLALCCLAPFFGIAETFPGGDTWAVLMLVGEVPLMLHGLSLLARNLVGASAAERSRTRLIGAAVLIAGLSTAIELVGIAGASWTPHIVVWGLLVSALLLGAAALRMLEGITFLTWVNSAAIALVVVLAELAVFRMLEHRSALVVVLTVVVLLSGAMALRFVVGDYAAERERTLAHASLGSLAAQMAHDIKNPLASIRGAAQFLAGERAAGRTIDGQGEFLTLLVDQCDRLARIVDQYQRIGRAQPVFSASSLNAAVTEAIKLFAGAVPLDTKLADGLPEAELDHDLVVIALENLLRNAHEAEPGKMIHVETGAAEGQVWVEVRDEGPGMNPRTRERALAGFFTTKTQGSGLGLAFVRRVTESHRGKLRIASREGHGTTVRIEVPSR